MPERHEKAFRQEVRGKLRDFVPSGYICRVRSLPIDTQRLAKLLEEAGVSQAQIEAQLAVLSQMVQVSDLATRADLRKLALHFKKELRVTETQLRGEIVALETRLSKKMQELEASLRKEMQELEARLRKEIAKSEARLRSEIEKSELRLRAEITQSQSRVTFWVAGLLLAQGALYITLRSSFTSYPGLYEIGRASLLISNPLSGFFFDYFLC